MQRKEEKIKLINLLKEENHSQREIAEKVGVSQGFVQKVLNKKKDNFYKHENYVAICKSTKKEIKDFRNKSGYIAEYLKRDLNIDLPSKYIRKKHELKTGRYWHEKYFDIIERKPKQKKKCKFCEWETVDLENKSGCYTTHLSKEHNMNVTDYLKIHPEESSLFLMHTRNEKIKEFIEKDEKNRIKCQICGEYMRKINHTHLKKHNITLGEYRKKYGTTLSETSRIKFSNKRRQMNFKMFQKNKEQTVIEKAIENKLSELNIRFETQKRVGNYFYDFYLNDYNYFIETDGYFWHGHDRKENWDIKIVHNIVNDYKKTIKVNKRVFRLIEGVSINHDNMKLINSVDSLFNFLRKEHYNIEDHKLFHMKENEIITAKDKLVGMDRYFEEKRSYRNLVYLWKHFYKPDDCDQFLNIDERRTIEFKLKGLFFKEFYKARKSNSKNLFDFFEDDKTIERVVKYRMGINKSNECFDINVKNLYRGLEVMKLFNVGIFPVKQAKDLYERFVDNNEIIFDPFSGWGSRAIGCKNLVLNKYCRYVGVDSNESLREGYKTIKKKFLENNNRFEFNISDSKLEIEKLNNTVDFIFTSPPFFNDEIYHDKQLEYNDLDKWREEMLNPIFKNCYGYLKKDSYMVIDMKQKYNDQIIKSCSDSGFIFHGIEEYKVSKSHYAKKDKVQNFLFFKKQ